MLATLAEGPLQAKGWVYEPKYDGIRAIVELDATGTVRFWSRQGNEKTAQFPEIAQALARGAKRLRRPLVLDMSTGTVANGKIMAARDAGTQVPRDWSVR